MIELASLNPFLPELRRLAMFDSVDGRDSFGHSPWLVLLSRSHFDAQRRSKTHPSWLESFDHSLWRAERLIRMLVRCILTTSSGIFSPSMQSVDLRPSAGGIRRAEVVPRRGL